MTTLRWITCVLLAVLVATGAGMARAQAEQIAPADIPSGWEQQEMGAVRLAVPPGWARVEDRKRSKIWFGGDMDTITGPSVGLMMDRDAEDIIPPGEDTVALDPVELAGGLIFDRATTVQQVTEKVRIEAIVLRSRVPDADGYYTGIMMGGYNSAYEDHAAIFDQVLGSLRAVGAPEPDIARDEPAEEPPARETGQEVAATPARALDGLLDYALPDGWITAGGASDPLLGLLPPTQSGFVTLARGAAVTGDAGLLAALPDTAAYRKTTLMGHEADLFEWQGGAPEFQSDDGLAAGVYRLFVLRNCAPEDTRIAVQLAGTPAFITGATLGTLLDGMRVTLPDGAAPCPDLPRLADTTATAEAEPQASEPTDTADRSPPAPDPALPPVPETPSDDRFTEQGNGWALYENDRYGTHISFPANYFKPEAPPANGDGRTFTSVDGTASFYVFAQYNALGLSLEESLEQDWQLGGYDEVTYQKSGAGWYVLSGYVGPDIFYRRVIHNGPDGLIRVFEIRYPAARKKDFDAAVTYMANTFGPAAETVTQPSTTGSDQSAQSGWPPVQMANLHTPQRKTALRTALMDAARLPIGNEVGQHVIFIVQTLNTDGTWAYLQARPVQPNGQPIDWSRTRFAQDFAQGFMSDIAMVLMLNRGNGWQVVDYVMGPTDVAWYSWLDPYGLPEAFFLSR